MYVVTVLCKSNESKFQRNSCIVLIEIPRKGNFAHLTFELSWKSTKIRKIARNFVEEKEKSKKQNINENLR